MAQIEFEWRSVGYTVMVLPDPQKPESLLGVSATRGFRRTVLEGAIDLFGQSVGMKGESEIQPDINALYRAYLVQ